MQRRGLIGVAIALLLSSLAVPAAGYKARTPRTASACEPYRQLARAWGCPSSNYLLRFGWHYCREFQTDRLNYTPVGRTVTDRIRSCLIRHVRETPDLTCRNVEESAIAGHTDCYLDSGFCTLAESDKWRIYATIWRELFDSRVVAVANAIQLGCDERRWPERQ